MRGTFQMTYADHCRKLFEGASLEVEDLYLLEAYQIADLRQRAPERALAAVLHARPDLQRFFVTKSPEAAVFLGDLRQRFGPAASDEELRQLVDDLVWEIADLILYGKAPALYDERAVSGRDHGEVFAQVFAAAPVEGKVVIDAGAGTGRVAFAAASSARHVFAVEPNTGMRHYLRQMAKQRSVRNLYALDGFLDAIPLPDDTADVLVTCNAIGWRLEQELPEIERVVRPGGWAVHLMSGQEDGDDNPIFTTLTSPAWGYQVTRLGGGGVLEVMFLKEVTADDG
jgi:SAM-dependent methyltransferase